MKQDVYDAVLGVGIELGCDLSPKVAFLLEESKEALTVAFDLSGAIGGLSEVVRDLDEPGVRKPPGTRKLKDSIVDRRFKHKQDAKTPGIRLNIDANIIAFGCRFHCACGGFDLLLIEW